MDSGPWCRIPEGKPGAGIVIKDAIADITLQQILTRPEDFDVIATPNLNGDYLSDALAAQVGGIGIAPGANINPEKDYPSMFEPVHGSAPDIAGRGIANPIGQIWSGAMMLDHLGENAAAVAVERAIEMVLATGEPRTPDLGGKATTSDLGRAVEAALT